MFVLERWRKRSTINPFSTSLVWQSGYQHLRAVHLVSEDIKPIMKRHDWHNASRYIIIANIYLNAYFFWHISSWSSLASQYRFFSNLLKNSKFKYLVHMYYAFIWHQQNKKFMWHETFIHSIWDFNRVAAARPLAASPGPIYFLFQENCLSPLTCTFLT